MSPGLRLLTTLRQGAVLTAEPNNIRIYYDGACPFCNSYVRLLRLRTSFNVELIDVRKNPSVIRRFAAGGIDLNVGMVAEVGSAWYHGADAIQFLAMVDTPKRTFNWINYHLSRHGWVARCLYPLMRWARSIILAVTRRGSIRDN